MGTSLGHPDAEGTVSEQLLLGFGPCGREWAMDKLPAGATREYSIIPEGYKLHVTTIAVVLCPQDFPFL